MKATKNEFPNPVLAAGRDDYISTCSFFTSFDSSDIQVTNDYIIIPISYELNCIGLQKLINSNKAVVVISIKSTGASYSKLFIFNPGINEMKIKIPKYSVVKRIDITGSIIATEVIHDFFCKGEFNELYFGNQTFEIRKGDILACENSKVIYIDDTELEKPLASIFNINNGHNQEDQIITDFSGEKIEINLCETLYKLYINFIEFNNGALRRYVTAVIVYPVLVEAIARICEAYQTNSEEQHLRWFRAIDLKATNKNISLSQIPDSYSSVANVLLGDISLDALQRLKDILENELNSGESQTLGGVD